jgi:hypothetical protein
MYLFVDPDLYEDDAKCLAIIELFVAEFKIPIEEALKKSRKPQQLLKLYRAKEIAPTYEEQIEIPLGTEELVNMAARTSVKSNPGKVEERAGERPEEPSEAECFAGVVPSLGLASKSDEFLKILVKFLNERGLGSITRHVRFLRFIRDTYAHWSMTPRKVFTDAQLEVWFREHQDGNPFGSKP